MTAGNRIRVVDPGPGLEEGLNIVEAPGDVPAYQVLLARELSGEGKALWIDVGNQASTYELAEAGDENLLERTYVARAFTALQHYDACNRLDETLDSGFEVLVFPEINLLYETGQLVEREAEELFRRTAESITEAAGKYGLKVLVSVAKTEDPSLEFLVQGSSVNKIRFEHTGQGLRWSSGSRETLFYSQPGAIQTTIPYWRRKAKPGEHPVAVDSNGKD